MRLIRREKEEKLDIGKQNIQINSVLRFENMLVNMAMSMQGSIFLQNFRISLKGIESTVRYFKRVHLPKKVREERHKEHPQPVISLHSQPRGRPPILLELNTKLIKFLRAVCTKVES